MTTEDQTEQTQEATREPSQYETAMTIADTLGETEEQRQRYIVYLVRVLGRTQARRLLNETLQIEESGGMLDQDRQRSASEVYFHLAVTKGKPKRNAVISPFRPRQDGEVGELLDPVAVAREIAEALHETEQAQFQQLIAIVRALGQTQARALLQETLDIEAQGGMMLPDGSRRRTPGGIYFSLAYTKGQPKEGQKLRRPTFKKPESEKQEQKAGTSQPTPQPQPQAIPPFKWEDRITAIQEAETERGTTNVKITLVGRPGKIINRGTCIVTVMESTKVPALPKGLPTPTAASTRYAVYISSKQWKKVAEAIEDPEDVLILEGFPTTDAEVGAIAVFATNVTTKKLQMAQKAKQQIPAE